MNRRDKQRPPEASGAPFFSELARPFAPGEERALGVNLPLEGPPLLPVGLAIDPDIAGSFVVTDFSFRLQAQRILVEGGDVPARVFQRGAVPLSFELLPIDMRGMSVHLAVRNISDKPERFRAELLTRAETTCEDLIGDVEGFEPNEGEAKGRKFPLALRSEGSIAPGETVRLVVEMDPIDGSTSRATLRKPLLVVPGPIAKHFRMESVWVGEQEQPFSFRPCTDFDPEQHQAGPSLAIQDGTSFALVVLNTSKEASPFVAVLVGTVDLEGHKATP